MRFCCLFVFACFPALAQLAPTTNVIGTVADPSGSVMPNAAVELTNTATHWTRHTATDEQGRFQFTLVPPGRYDILVTAGGFASIRQEGVNLDVDVPATLRFTLSVATATTSITIHEDTPMVDAQSGALRQVVGERYIEDLPLNGRNAAALVYMAPGTVIGKGTDTATYATNGDNLAISANGTMGNQVSYKLDGASHSDNINNLNAGFPNPDALAQFSVETNNFDARYGGSGGAVVNIVTPSGSNAPHGTVFEFLPTGRPRPHRRPYPEGQALLLRILPAHPPEQHHLRQHGLRPHRRGAHRRLLRPQGHQGSGHRYCLPRQHHPRRSDLPHCPRDDAQDPYVHRPRRQAPLRPALFFRQPADPRQVRLQRRRTPDLHQLLPHPLHHPRLGRRPDAPDLQDWPGPDHPLLQSRRHLDRHPAPAQLPHLRRPDSQFHPDPHRALLHLRLRRL